MKFSDRLKGLRKKNNLTQDALSQKIFVSRSLISKYENGSVIPTHENLSRIADYFKISTTEIMGDEESFTLTLHAHDSYKKIKVLVGLFFALLSIVFIILLCPPIFEYDHYTGSSDASSTYVHGMTSILIANLKYGSLYALFSLILNILSLISFVVLIIDFDKKIDLKIKIITTTIFVINIAIFILAFISEANIIYSKNFQMNYHH